MCGRMGAMASRLLLAGRLCLPQRAGAPDLMAPCGTSCGRWLCVGPHAVRMVDR